MGIFGNSNIINKKMKQLEFKHIAPYLPYGLMIKVENGVDTIESIDEEGTANIDCEFSYEMGEYKPILRPIGSITKEEAYELGTILISEADMEDKEIGIGEMTLMGVTYPTIMYQDQEDEDYSVMIRFSSIGISGIDLIPYEAYEWLFKNHFDVFGLINRGLAVIK